MGPTCSCFVVRFVCLITAAGLLAATLYPADVHAVVEPENDVLWSVVACLQVMNVYDFAAKVAAVWQECSAVSEDVFQRIRPELSEDFNDNYRLAVRISQFEYQRLNPSVEQQLQVLGLPDPVVRQPAPRLGVCGVTSGAAVPLLQYPEAVSWAEGHVLSSSPVMLNALQVLPFWHHVAPLRMCRQ